MCIRDSSTTGTSCNKEIERSEVNIATLSIAGRTCSTRGTLDDVNGKVKSSYTRTELRSNVSFSISLSLFVSLICFVCLFVSLFVCFTVLHERTSSSPSVQPEQCDFISSACNHHPSSPALHPPLLFIKQLSSKAVGQAFKKIARIKRIVRSGCRLESKSVRRLA